MTKTGLVIEGRGHSQKIGQKTMMVVMGVEGGGGGSV
jgi:hypothetical protein